MLKDAVESQRDSHFAAAVIEYYPNKANKNGHAITLLRGKDSIFYIIDDQRAILPIEEYINTKSERIYRFSVQNITQAAIDELNSQLEQGGLADADNKFIACPTRYEYVLPERFINKISESIVAEDVSKESVSKNLSLMEVPVYVSPIEVPREFVSINMSPVNANQGILSMEFVSKNMLPADVSDKFSLKALISISLLIAVVVGVVSYKLGRKRCQK
jgi:hypothetical protein